uniref:Acetyl-CoA carboxylase (Fragments) n=1 Tax=Catharanthus roseus TaxID=4058 RepID=ACAC_CATRO|nr:RecName: Full=Acetyl-CoA carboxylase; Short=ACC [Catharanthus roseus]
RISSSVIAHKTQLDSGKREVYSSHMQLGGPK